MAAELVETTRLYARNVARIAPEWIEPLAVHLVKRHYSDPHWDKTRGMVMAYERVTLHGLTIVPRRRVHYGPINPLEAREIFIHRALAAGELETRGDFFRHNRKLIAELKVLEAKARRRDVLVDEHTVYEFNVAPPQGGAEQTLFAVVDVQVVADVALFEQDLRERALLLGGRDVDVTVTGLLGVADARQVVGYGISDSTHRCCFVLASMRRPAYRVPRRT